MAVSLRDLAGSTITDIIIRVILVGTMIFCGGFIWQYQSFVNCQAEYNDIQNNRLRVLTGVNVKKEEALNTLLLDPAVLIPQEERTPEEQQRIKDKTLAWVEAARKQEEARIANPIPPSPNQMCG